MWCDSLFLNTLYVYVTHHLVYANVSVVARYRFLHRKKSQFTLVPLYAYISILTIFTHNFSDLGFAVIINEWFFLIASFAFFTTLMFSTLYLYLFEGPRAGRLALWAILLCSFFYIAIVYITGIETDTANWISLDSTRVWYYFWSLLAVVFDVIFLAIGWELLSRVKYFPLVIRVFLITFFVFALDTIIFTSGVYGNSGMYLSILEGNILIRLGLSFLGAPIMAYFLKMEGFSEEKRTKPKNFWEIVNFRSDLEIKIVGLKETIVKHEDLEEKLRQTEETYQLALAGIGAGVWDWNTITDEIIWSDKLCMMLGYAPGEMEGNLSVFKKALHPEDIKRTFDMIEKCMKTKRNYEIEYRLKTKSGKYRWFLANGVTKYNDKEQPIRMVGSIIDIHEKKENADLLKKKVDELSNMNKIMVGREERMMELKEEIKKLKKSL